MEDSNTLFPPLRSWSQNTRNISRSMERIITLDLLEGTKPLLLINSLTVLPIEELPFVFQDKPISTRKVTLRTEDPPPIWILAKLPPNWYLQPFLTDKLLQI